MLPTKHNKVDKSSSGLCFHILSYYIVGCYNFFTSVETTDFQAEAVSNGLNHFVYSPCKDQA